MNHLKLGERIKIRNGTYNLHHCISEDSSTSQPFLDVGLLEQIACQIRINLSSPNASENPVLIGNDLGNVLEFGHETSPTFTENGEDTEIKLEAEDPVSVYSDEEFEGETVDTTGHEFRLSAMSLDKLIARKGLSEHVFKRLMESKCVGDDTVSSDENANEVEKLEDNGRSNSPWSDFDTSTCSKCGAEFHSGQKEEFSNHIKCCPKTNVICVVCKEIFLCVDKLNAHMTCVHRMNPWSCSLCNASFARKKNLVHHVTTDHDERNFKCEKCGKRFASEENLTIHAKSHNKAKTFVCPECGKAFVYKTKLDSHMLVHSKTGKPFKCDQCDSTFVRKASLVMHVKRTHDDPLNCKICGTKIKGSTASLRKHMLNVHGEKYKYDCDICGNEFETAYELQAHKKSHVNSYQCNICGKVFTWKGSYKQHMERHSDTPKYDCPKCGKSFYTKDSVQKHVKYTHGNNRNYHCDECGMSFKTIEVLKHHMEIHENKRKYKCKICDKGFNNPSSLTNHRKVHSKKSTT